MPTVTKFVLIIWFCFLFSTVMFILVLMFPVQCIICCMFVCQQKTAFHQSGKSGLDLIQRCSSSFPGIHRHPALIADSTQNKGRRTGRCHHVNDINVYLDRQRGEGPPPEETYQMFEATAHGHIGTSGKGFKTVWTLLLSKLTRFQDCFDALSSGSVFMCMTPLGLYNSIIFTSSFLYSSVKQAAKKCLVNLI